MRTFQALSLEWVELFGASPRSQGEKASSPSMNWARLYLQLQLRD